MTDTEISAEASPFDTVDSLELVNKSELAGRKTRDGSFIIEEPLEDGRRDPAQSSESKNDVTLDSNLQLNMDERFLPSVTRVHTQNPSQELFTLLQKWEGTVIEVKEDALLATLRDLSMGGDDEEAEIPFEEISQADMPLMTKGSVFYWCIGYRDTKSGQRIRASEIRFRRQPVWSKRELDSARREADQISAILGWDSPANGAGQ